MEERMELEEEFEGPNRPRPAVLLAWRMTLAAVTVIPALFNSLLFRVGSVPWLVITGVWVLIFLFFYLFYLPVRYRRMSFRLAEDRLVQYNGVFYDNITALPLYNVQFVVLLANPLERVFGLRTLRVTAPGGRMVLPGMAEQDARALLDILHRRRELTQQPPGGMRKHQAEPPTGNA